MMSALPRSSFQVLRIACISSYRSREATSPDKVSDRFRRMVDYSNHDLIAWLEACVLLL